METSVSGEMEGFLRMESEADGPDEGEVQSSMVDNPLLAFSLNSSV